MATQDTQNHISLYVDEFSIKYFSKNDAYHLIKSSKNHNYVTFNWEGKICCGLYLKCNREEV